MSNHITIELCQEDRERLDRLNSSLIALGDVLLKRRPVALEDLIQPGTIQAPAEEPTAPQEAPKSEPVKSDHPADAVPPHAEPQDVAPAEEPKPTVTLEQIRKKVTLLRASSDQKKKDGAKDIVLAYAPNITGLANCEDKWPEIWDKLTALEG
jgi:hypothetical protein